MKAGGKTLVVDDSNAMLEMMQDMLKENGVMDVTAASDGLQAVSRFREALQEGAPYSLVFLDIVMPELDGQETLKRMRAMEKEVDTPAGEKAVIIMVTSLHSTSDMMSAIIDGDCTDYLVKPFEEQHLRDMLVKYEFCNR